MTDKKHKTEVRFLEGLVSEDRDLVKSLMREALQEVLEAEMTEVIERCLGSGVKGGVRIVRAIILAA